MKIFISGKITNDPKYKEKFATAEKKLTEQGHVVLNPAVLPKGMSNTEYMKIGFAMFDCADALYMLDGWQDSEGAKIEHTYAQYLGKDIIYEINNNNNYFPTVDKNINTIGVYDKTEIHKDCQVEVWQNSITGETSIGWRKNNGFSLKEKYENLVCDLYNWLEDLDEENMSDDEEYTKQLIEDSIKAIEQLMGN